MGNRKDGISPLTQPNNQSVKGVELLGQAITPSLAKLPVSAASIAIITQNRNFFTQQLRVISQSRTWQVSNNLIAVTMLDQRILLHTFLWGLNSKPALLALRILLDQETIILLLEIKNLESQ